MSDWNFFEARDQAVQFDGLSQYGWRGNPSFGHAANGAISGWVKINRILSSDGVNHIVGMCDATPGSNKFISFNLRRNAGFPSPTGTYIGVTQFPGPLVGTTSAWYGYAPDPVGLGDIYHFVFDSNGKLYLNAADQSIVSPTAILLRPIWFDQIYGTDHDFSVGARRVGGTVDQHAQIDVNDMIYLPDRVFTPAEVSEIYSKGMGADFESLSMYSELAMILPFDGDANDIKGSNHLTLASTATPTPVLPTFIDV